jgi:hypothetical protein
MIFDSQEQKNYIIKAVASCKEWTHQESLQLSGMFDRAIQDGEIVKAEETGKVKTEGGMKPPKPQSHGKNNNQKEDQPAGAAA